MKKLRIYLDTSVVNFLFAEDAPDFRRVTEDLFARHEHKYELFTSWNFNGRERAQGNAQSCRALGCLHRALGNRLFEDSEALAGLPAAMKTQEWQTN